MMDPNTTLGQIRALLNTTAGIGTDDRLREMFEDLDHWLTNGGFLPHDWDHPHGFTADGEYGW